MGSPHAVWAAMSAGACEHRKETGERGAYRGDPVCTYTPEVPVLPRCAHDRCPVLQQAGLEVTVPHGT